MKCFSLQKALGATTFFRSRRKWEKTTKAARAAVTQDWNARARCVSDPLIEKENATEARSIRGTKKTKKKKENTVNTTAAPLPSLDVIKFRGLLHLTLENILSFSLSHLSSFHAFSLTKKITSSPEGA